MCGQSVNEFLNQVVGRHDPLFLQIFRQELDFPIRDLRKSMLSDWWASKNKAQVPGLGVSAKVVHAVGSTMLLE
jgi:hypothetical protein